MVFKNSVFLLNLKAILQRFEISVEMVKLFEFIKQFCILHMSISYCVSLIMVTITRYVFNNIFQTEHFSAVKFSIMGYEKN